MGHLLGLRKRLVRAVTQHNVRVAVLHRAQWLLQWIEGAPGAVDMAWQRIQRMPELRQNRLLHRSLGAPTLQEPLQIASVCRREAPEQVGRRIAQLANSARPGDEPVRLWNALVAPGDVPPCGSIVIASAREHDGVDLLRRMAQRHASEIVYRRFAAADPAQFDSGAAYADFASPCRCCVRVHVLSRRCLRNELVLGELTKVRDLVLLLGTRTALCEQLAHAAARVVGMHGAATRIHLLARDAHELSVVESLLRHAGVEAQVLARTLRPGAEEADYVEAALAATESELPATCPSWDQSPPARVA